jgi:hypothetical protein
MTTVEKVTKSIDTWIKNHYETLCDDYIAGRQEIDICFTRYCIKRYFEAYNTWVQTNQIKYRTCTKCQRTNLVDDDFYRSLSTICKACHRKYVKKNRKRTYNYVISK